MIHCSECNEESSMNTWWSRVSVACPLSLSQSSFCSCRPQFYGDMKLSGPFLEKKIIGWCSCVDSLVLGHGRKLSCLSSCTSKLFVVSYCNQPYLNTINLPYRKCYSNVCYTLPDSVIFNLLICNGGRVPTA